ncbi:MAG: hypothetical protein DMF74_23090 [Acidobacteria bacterium]|nr:MAG: hypothetical protein DMF74_23090 [Acidobacteriota bacterium]
MQMMRRGRIRTREKVYAILLRTGSLCSSESVARVNTSKQRESGWNTLSRMAALLFSSMALTQILIGQGRFKSNAHLRFFEPRVYRIRTKSLSNTQKEGPNFSGPSTFNGW